MKNKSVTQKMDQGMTGLFYSSKPANRYCSHPHQQCNNICSRPEETIINDNKKRDANSQTTITTCVPFRPLSMLYTPH